MNRPLPDVVVEKGPSFSRRWLLRGLGAALPIPVLGSLLSASDARADATQRTPLFLPVLLPQSNVGRDSMCPAPRAPDETKSYAGHTIRRTELRPTTANGLTSVSKVLTASSSMLTANLVSKMNLIRGVDWPRSMGHNSTQLGCYSGELIDPAQTTLNPAWYRRSIDQVLAQSPSFYRTFNGVSKAATASYFSAGSYASPTLSVGASGQAVTGGTAACNGPQALFDHFFKGASAMPEARKSTVDLVKESYSRLSKNPRLSRVDKGRLDEHVERIADLDRRLNLVRAPCSTPARPMPAPVTVYSAATAEEQCGMLIDTVVSAFACGLTRIIVLPLWHTFGDLNPDDWHQQVEHLANEPDYVAQNRQVTAVRETFARFVVPLAAKLNAVDEGNGKTLLDRTLLLQMPSMGDVGHSTTGRVMVTFGSADGAFRTGNHLDYRNLERTPIKTGASAPEFADAPVGLTMQQFYASFLQLFGIPRSDWDEPTTYGGYGPRFSDSERVYPAVSWSELIGSQYPASVWNAAGDVLPWLGAA